METEGKTFEVPRELIHMQTKVHQAVQVLRDCDDPITVDVAQHLQKLADAVTTALLDQWSAWFSLYESKHDVSEFRSYLESIQVHEEAHNG